MKSKVIENKIQDDLRLVMKAYEETASNDCEVDLSTVKITY